MTTSKDACGTIVPRAKSLAEPHVSSTGSVASVEGGRQGVVCLSPSWVSAAERWRDHLLPAPPFSEGPKACSACCPASDHVVAFFILPLRHETSAWQSKTSAGGGMDYIEVRLRSEPPPLLLPARPSPVKWRLQDVALGLLVLMGFAAVLPTPRTIDRMIASTQRWLVAVDRIPRPYASAASAVTISRGSCRSGIVPLCPALSALPEPTSGNPPLRPWECHARSAKFWMSANTRTLATFWW